jgi:predicted TPR repeat methyltransferase
LAQALRVSLMPGREWLAGLRELDAAGRTLVLDLKGCPQTQRALVLDLTSRVDAAAPPAAELFDLVLRQRRVIGEAAARQLCLRLLPHVPQRFDAFGASFVSLTAAEQARVLALAAELKQNPDQAETHWLRLIKLLRATPDAKQPAALVLRRLADEHAHHHPDGELCSHAVDWLGQSLELDPADRATHLRLIRDARKSGDLKQARLRLEAAHKRFPDDAPMLLEEVEIALAAGAFKKAAGLAKQVLELDPINPHVRTVIGQAHLAHARKHLVAKNLPAARRELDEAATWLRSGSERGLLKLLQGFAAASAGVGDTLLREALVELGGPFVGSFHMLLEGERAKLVPKDLLHRAGVDLDLAATPSGVEVVALAHALDGLPERDPALHTALDPLRDMLERAADTPQLSEDEHLLVCETLHRHGESELMRKFAVAALARWPKRLVFVYLEAAARFGAQPWLMPEREWRRLNDVLDQARDAGDHRTAARLIKLLDASDDGPFDDDMSADDDEADDDDFRPADLRGMLDVLLKLGHVDRLIDMAREKFGKAAIDALQREVGGSKKKLAQALLEMMTPPGRPPTPRAKNQPDLLED